MDFQTTNIRRRFWRGHLKI